MLHQGPDGSLSLSNQSHRCLVPQANHCSVHKAVSAGRPVAPISLPRELTSGSCWPCLSMPLQAAHSVCATWCLLGTLLHQPLLHRHSGSSLSPACAVTSGTPLSVHQPVSAGRPVPRRVAAAPGTAGGPAPPTSPPPVPHRAVQRPGASAGQLQVCCGHGGAEREPRHAGCAGPPVCEGCRWALFAKQCVLNGTCSLFACLGPQSCPACSPGLLQQCAQGCGCLPDCVLE